MIEPNCDMPWEIYLDWLQDQCNDDLRDIDIQCFFSNAGNCFGYHHNSENLCAGDGSRAYYFNELMRVNDFECRWGGGHNGGFHSPSRLDPYLDTRGSG